jgi:hypothetical protein
MNEKLPPCAFGCKQISNKSGIYSNCPGTIGTDFLSERVIFVCLHCKCSSPPLICHRCRSIYGGSNITCIFCQKPGIAGTIRKPSSEALSPVQNWYRIRTNNIEIPIQCRSIMDSWRVFSEIFQRNSANYAFKTWLDFQRVRIGPLQSINTLYAFSSIHQILSLKNVTIARMLVCKLFVDKKSMDRTMFLYKSYLPLRRNYLSQKVLYGVLRRMIATAAWFQDPSRQFHLR